MQIAYVFQKGNEMPQNDYDTQSMVEGGSGQMIKNLAKELPKKKKSSSLILSPTKKPDIKRQKVNEKVSNWLKKNEKN